MAKDAPKMAGYRSRDKSSGKLRRKRADTKVSALHRVYHRIFGKKEGIQLGTLLKRKRRSSLKKLLGKKN